MERDHPTKLQMNHQSSTAPQRSFLICASATTKGGTIKAMNYTPGDLALTEYPCSRVRTYDSIALWNRAAYPFLLFRCAYWHWMAISYPNLMMIHQICAIIKKMLTAITSKALRVRGSSARKEGQAMEMCQAAIRWIDRRMAASWKGERSCLISRNNSR